MTAWAENMMVDNTLAVANLPDEFAHKGIAVFNEEDLHQLGGGSGNFIQLKGSRKTTVRAKTSPSANPGIIYLDATTRLNLSSRSGELIEFKIIEEPRTLDRIFVASVNNPDEGEIEHLIGANLLGRSICKGDHITIPSPNGGILEIQAEKLRPLILPNGGVIGPKTHVELYERKARRPLLDTGDVSFADIGGLDDVIEQIQEVAVVPLIHPEIFLRGGKPPIRGILLHGEPGTGKSLLARALARETQATFYSISAPEVIGSTLGDAEKFLRELFQEAKETSPSVIFIDEIDTIASDRHNGSEMSRRLVSQLLTLLDGMEDRGQVVVIGATNRISSIDPAVNRSGRFERVIECNVPDYDGRLKIIEIHARGMPLNEDVELESLAELMVGFVGADIDHMCREAVYRAANRAFGLTKMLEFDKLEIDEFEIIQEDLELAISRIRPSLKRRHQTDVAEVDFDSIIGQEHAKTVLKEKLLLPLKFPELYSLAGLSIGSGVLLYGPPGTGKTALARAAANVAGAQFLSVKGPELMSMWVGESERAVRDIIDKARKMVPCVLFLDEFDSLGSDRTALGAGHSGKRDVVNQLLAEMDGINSKDGVLFIAATNQKELIDPAFLRQGRLGNQIKVSLPNKKEYSPIIALHLRDVSQDENINIISCARDLPDNLSGADLAGIAIRIKEIAVNRHLEINQEGDTDGFKVEQIDVESACNELMGIL
jgi:transitional endoplasmic reticulum ATPase